MTLLVLTAIIAAALTFTYITQPCESVVAKRPLATRFKRTHLLKTGVDQKKKELFNLMEENLFANDPTLQCTLAYANMKKLPQDHPCVLELVRKYMKKPSPRNVPYKFKFAKNLLETSGGQLTAVMRLLNNQTGGFFVECGAADGEAFSNTLFLEGHLNWTGLLIEPDPESFDTLTNKVNRKSWKINACLSPEKYPVEVSFKRGLVVGKIYEGADNDNELNPKLIKAQCFPLYSYLLAHGRTNVDYFSLDVEGQELAVLRTIPWHKVDLKILTVEWEWIKEGQRTVIEFMEKNGYIHFGNIASKSAKDNVFVKDLLSDLRPEYDEYFPPKDSPYAEEMPLEEKNT